MKTEVHSGAKTNLIDAAKNEATNLQATIRQMSQEIVAGEMEADAVVPWLNFFNCVLVWPYR